MKGGPAFLTVSDLRLNEFGLGSPSPLWWLPDGQIIFALAQPAPNQFDSNLWEIQVESRTGETRGGSKRLTN